MLAAAAATSVRCCRCRYTQGVSPVTGIHWMLIGLHYAAAASSRNCFAADCVTFIRTLFTVSAR